LTAGLLFVGLWPFDTSPKNRACWIPDQGGLYFDGQERWPKLSVGGIAYTSSALSSLKPAPSEKGSFTIEILLKPAQDLSGGVPRILSLIDGTDKEAFYLGQWRRSLIVRWFYYDQRGKRRVGEIGAWEALIEGRTKRLTIVSSQESTGIYLDGEIAKSFQGTALIGEKESIRGYSLVLGNSREVKSPWSGTILALNVYEHSLNEREIARNRNGSPEGAPNEGLIAAFALEKHHGASISDVSGNKNTLTVPERVTLRNSILAWPDWRNQKDSSPAKDIVVNILGFMPLGFLLAFWRKQANGSRRWETILLTIVMGALISLCIEVTQAFIPARDSSMVDFLCNIVGTAIGGGLWEARKLIAYSA
jgi:hypothetical protein